MLHDPADVYKSPLNFISTSSRCLTKTDLVSASTPSQLNLLDASLNCSAKALKSHLLPTTSSTSSTSSSSATVQATEKLSWKFFEQVDTLDHQLRSDVVSNKHIRLLSKMLTQTQTQYGSFFD